MEGALKYGNMELAIERACNDIDALCAPSKMSKAEAVEYLERVACNVDASIEALKEEIANEEGPQD